MSPDESTWTTVSARRSGVGAMGRVVLLSLCFLFPVGSAGCLSVAVSSDGANQRVTDVLISMLRPVRETAQQRDWSQEFIRLSPAEMRLCTRSLGTIYWERTRREYGVYASDVIRRLFGIGTDSSTEELMRIVLYSGDMEAIRYILYSFLLEPPGFETYPVVMKFLERKELSEDMRKLATGLGVLNVSPVLFSNSEQITRGVVKDLAGRTDHNTVLRMHAQHWEKQFKQLASLAHELADCTNTKTEARRRERGLAGRLYPGPPRPPARDVEDVLELLKRKLNEGKGRRKGNGKGDGGNVDAAAKKSTEAKE